MKVLAVRNVHEALPRALALIQREGIARGSRNGEVLLAPWPVTTVYAKPTERVLFWPERDANPAFHLYESLWMLAGRNDLAPLVRYVKDFGKFSDDGKTLSGAYGYQWRRAFDDDQLAVIAARLRANPEDRRCVLQMWDATYHLGADWKDVPCNTTATLQCDAEGRLDLTVFCRSNDIVWGAYGANAVHFSVLQEYLAGWIGCPVGVYRQVSVNWHAYRETLASVAGLPERVFAAPFSVPAPVPNPYADGSVRAVPLLSGTGPDAIADFDERMRELLMHVDTGFALPRMSNDDEPFFEVAYAVLRAHEAWRTLPAAERYSEALAALRRADPQADFVLAMREWVERRQAKWEARMRREVHADPQQAAVFGIVAGGPVG